MSSTQSSQPLNTGSANNSTAYQDQRLLNALAKQLTKNVSQKPQAAKSHLQWLIKRSGDRVLPNENRFKATNFFQSIGFALEGWAYAFKTQRNFRIDVLITAVTIAAGLFFQISWTSWLALAFALGLLLFAECANTSVELLVDAWTQGEFDIRAKRVKDVMAGACLLVALATLTIQLMVFAPKVWALLPA
ncbi:MAG: diacylglycerol kinase family protein [Vampirovibrionales bacterium]|nr:diacylglycerol kinase family protein [Vampirovibrionales bacterium]